MPVPSRLPVAAKLDGFRMTMRQGMLGSCSCRGRGSAPVRPASTPTLETQSREGDRGARDATSRVQLAAPTGSATTLRRKGSTTRPTAGGSSANGQ